MKLPYSDLRIAAFGGGNSASVTLARQIVALCQKKEPRFSLHVFNGPDAVAEINRTCGFFIASGEDSFSIKLVREMMSEGTITIIVGKSDDSLLPRRNIFDDVVAAVELIVGIRRSPNKYFAWRSEAGGIAREVDNGVGFSAQIKATADASSQMPYQELCKIIREVKVACIMDEFTWKSYSPEANMIQLVPEDWRNQLDSFLPDFIFVESAWRGVADKWTNVIHRIPEELKGILAWANAHCVSTVFWNKEDPVHFDTFKNVASLFDFIFTYDFNCVAKYKAITGRDNAFFLPMAVQPRMFNPIEKYERKDAFCFAGSYYRRYPERTRDLDGYIHAFPACKPVEIFDRQYGKTDPHYMMPPEYAPYIKGGLPYDQIDRAYKGYTIAINLNSIKQANSIARRVFELLACNTVTVSNYSYGVVKGFGDLVITSDNAEVILSRLKKFETDRYGLDKLRLAGLRKVFSENTYADRFAYICSKVFDHDLTDVKPLAGMIAFIDSESEHEATRKIFARFDYPNKRLFMVSDSLTRRDDVYASFSDAVAEMKKCDYVGVLDPNDYYAEHYLEDLVYAFKYSAEKAVGKGQYFSLSDNQLLVRGKFKPYGVMPQVDLKMGMVSSMMLIDTVQNGEFKLGRGSTILHHSALSTDIFNYCESGVAANLNSSLTATVSDLARLDFGFAFSNMQKIAENLKPEKTEDRGNWISGQRLSMWCMSDKNIRSVYENGKLRLTSLLENGKFAYYPIRRDFLLFDISTPDGKMKLYFETSFSASACARIAYFFYDENNKKVLSSVGAVNANLTVDIPPMARSVRLQLRIQGPGVLEVYGMAFAHRPTPMPIYFDTGKILCLTNHYPSYDDLYRNGFVHSRIKSYAKHGVKVSVFELNGSVQPCFREFEGVNVIGGNADYLRFLLMNNQYKTVAVHFLDRDMWKVLGKLPGTTRIIVWCHGAEVLKYTSRLFNFERNEVPRAVIDQSNERAEFWEKLLRNLPSNLHFVFVSNWMKNIVDKEYLVQIPETSYSIVNNPIDTDIFQYCEKQEVQRYRILSIRPYATRKYANDLSVKCILELAKRKDFDKFEITMIGDGVLFDEVLAPLRKFKNVKIIRTFLRQSEIAAYHRFNGLFLVPTRQDAQGVSKDEAMSSGLVPITNDVTAMGEFVDSTCGILSPGEDYKDMAKQIGRIVDNPKLFLSMSKAAAARVRRQTASEIIIAKEIALLTGEDGV